VVSDKSGPKSRKKNSVSSEDNDGDSENANDFVMSDESEE